MKKFKIVVAGCGVMAKKWIEYALGREDSEIIALVDIKVENARLIAEKYVLQCPIFSDIKETIKHTRANLVFDVTIPESHRNIVIPAMEMGCDVFGEKPMAASMEEAKEMVAVAKKTGRTYAVMQNSRYLKNIRAFKELVTSGTVGNIGFVCADFFVGPHFGGFRELMKSPLILDMAIHTFDQVRFITNSNPISVYCHEFNPQWSWYKGNASAVCIFEFSNSIVFCYRGSWCAEGLITSWESTWRVIGSHGTALWDGYNPPFCEVPQPSEEKKLIWDTIKVEAALSWNGQEGHNGCLDEMFLALLEGRKAETDCTDNIKSMSMVFGALESARKGVKIKL